MSAPKKSSHCPEEQQVLDSTDQAYARDKAFWDNYLRGRPHAPDTFFERIYRYHAEHGGKFDVVHDVGAGVGPYTSKLRQKFKHVIVSDIVPENVKQAEQRLGTNGYSYRAAKLEDAKHLAVGSVDMVFASNCMHFADQGKAEEAFARQLNPGGTLVVGGFGVVSFKDPHIQDIWQRLRHEGARVLRRHTSPFEAIGRRMLTLARLTGGYDCVRVSEKYFVPGALRITLVDPDAGDYDRWVSFMPDDLQPLVPAEPSGAGPADVRVAEEMTGWAWQGDLQALKEQWATFAFAAMEPEAYEDMWRQMEEVMGNERVVEGWWPAKIIMATRREPN